MPRFPQDQFDELPADLERVGAHRGPAPRGRGWVRFAWGALASGVLVVAGLYGLSQISPDFQFELPIGGDSPTDSATVTPAPTAEPITDPAQAPAGLTIDISVLNASGVEGLQNTVGDEIAAAGWPDPVRAKASTEETTTIVYYSSADYEGVARGLAQLVGAADVRLTDAFPGAPLTIVLGSDLATPTAEETPAS
ncbi:MAG: LytR C-terminal domain-containing protein [Actinomycetales bacterium]|nr:LytR C-terminal domain-containing protein [Actinomycetales bacterium]